MGSKSKSNQSSSSQNVNSNQGVNSGVGINYGVNQSGNYGFNQGSSQNIGGSQSTGESFNQSSQDVWDMQSPFLQDVYQQAQNAFGQGMSDINALTPEVQQQMAQTLGAGNAAFQNQASGGNLSGMMGNGLSQGMFGNGIQQSMVGQGQTQNMAGNGASQQLLNSYGDNPYLAGMKGQIADDASMLKQQNLGSLDARAAAAGMSGSSGYRDQTGKMMKDVDKNALNQMTQLGYDSSKQAMQDKMALSQNTDNFNLNAANSANQFNAQMAGGADQTNLGAANAADQFNMGIGQGMNQSQQAAMNNMLAQQQGSMNMYNPSMMGMNMVGQYGNIIGGPTVLGQSSGGSSNQSTSFNQGSSNNMGMNAGFSNGMNVGMNQSGGFNNGYGYGASNGQGSSSSASLDPSVAAGTLSFLSDARLKENVKHVEQIDGVNLYTWDWHKDAPVTSPMNYGVMAQEVAETHPEAVTTGEHGYMVVDYSKLGRAGEVALARMEG